MKKSFIKKARIEVEDGNNNTMIVTEKMIKKLEWVA